MHGMHEVRGSSPLSSIEIARWNAGYLNVLSQGTVRDDPMSRNAWPTTMNPLRRSQPQPAAGSR